MTTVLPPATPSAVPAAAPSTAPAGAAALAVALAIRTDLWADRVEYREESRWTSLLDPADVAHAIDPSLHAELHDAQIWLLSWLPGQGTPLHDHGTSAGAFAVARGGLTERVVARGVDGAPRQSTADLAAGRVRFFGAHYVHQVVNTLHEPAVSVHVYAPRLTLMNTYRIDESGLVRVGTERAGVDW
ncbi:Cysteine dioxygenase type I [Klenkia marina]|uniref:Cysteine dioxygenase type I n=1 Tax=Klenkia marina TaxID=1960309 RepID=A0A1G4XUS7_9ACTN|nr:cysteine dioxygenase family protein [Klenkia marina]SCX44790.1 Cysteine dioxygenase type I [Klenkia marina]